MRGSDRLRQHPELPETQSLAGGGEGTAHWHGPPVKLEDDLLEDARTTKTALGQSSHAPLRRVQLMPRIIT